MGHFVGIVNWDKSPLSSSKLGILQSQSVSKPQIISPYPYVAFTVAGDAQIIVCDKSIAIFNGYLDDISLGDNNTAELALRAYKQSGDEFANNLIGHFACIIWDDEQHKLIAVRDLLGVKRLYHYQTSKSTIASNDFSQIQQLADTPLTLNEKLIKAYLQGDGRFWQTEGIYNEIKPIPPCHVATFTHNQRTQQAYTDWHVTPQSHKDKTAYIQQFNDTYWDMLRRYTHTTNQLGIMVSGGLDSSGLAAMLYAIRHSVSPKVQLFSTTTKRFKTADEQEYLSALAESCSDWTLHTHNLDDADYSQFVAINGEPASPFFVTMLRARIAFAKLHGIDTLFYGTGGDMVMLQNAALNLNFWIALPFLQKLQEAQYFIGAMGGILPFSKQLVRQFIKRRNTVASVDYVRHPIALPIERDLDQYHVVQQTILAPLMGQYSHALAILDTLAEENNIKLRFPYLDTKLMRFMMSVPASQHIHKGWGRVLQRRAMKDILPEKIRQRLTKGVADEMLTLYLSRENLLELANNSRLVDYGWIDKNKLIEVINTFHAGKTHLLLDLTRFDEIERWLQQHDP